MAPAGAPAMRREKLREPDGSAPVLGGEIRTDGPDKVTDTCARPGRLGTTGASLGVPMDSFGTDASAWNLPWWWW
jgi:hypothetical protein